MLSHRERLHRRRARPALVELHRALSRLKSTLTVMNTGAHPDDEHSGMLAVLRLAYGMRVVIACSTRGEGGQNALGPERGGALGVVRTREMEEAARTLDADVVWLGHGPDDPVHDFGFSKDGRDTLARWGRERIVERLVRAYRAERPDIVIPTFLDVPGQHGHHRAMTQAAEEAVRLATDPHAFPQHLKEGLTPWEVAKFYLPAWSGGGTYDDELPPPDVTVRVRAPGRDPATGAAHAEIGEWSRSFHATQGMGVWRPEPQTDWPLHLKLAGQGTESDISEGLPARLADLARGLGHATAEQLEAAQAHVDRALDAFPHRERIIEALAAAARHIEIAQARLSREEQQRFGHRLARKRVEIDAALGVAAGIVATVWAEPAALAPGSRGKLHVHLGPRDAASPVEIDLLLPEGISGGTAIHDASVTTFPIAVARAAPIGNAYPPSFSSLLGRPGLRVALRTEIGGRTVTLFAEPEEPVEIVPAHSVTLAPDALIVSTRARPGSRSVRARVDGPAASLALESTNGAAARREGEGFRVDIAPDIAPGRYSLDATVDGAPAYRQTPITYPHIGRARFVSRQNLDMLVVDLLLPQNARVGYVGGGADRVGLWLRRMGLDVTELDETDLRGDLKRFTTIVVGILAFGLRADLAEAVGRLNRWVEEGGHLLTLYHRPGDGWLPERTPPRRLVIGSPSLRWRVTNPAAPVEFLRPRHPLLSRPNAITAQDFTGWDKERGLYFASQWDGAYEPLLAMSDAGEAPLEGALLSASIGRGRHTHTSLVLHHQLDRLVPGAFRLMANLVQPA